jgi:molybdate-binding protein
VIINGYDAGLYKKLFKATEVNRRRGSGTREKVSWRRINLEGNTHVQESNVRNLPV